MSTHAPRRPIGSPRTRRHGVAGGAHGIVRSDHGELDRTRCRFGCLSRARRAPARGPHRGLPLVSGIALDSRAVGPGSCSCPAAGFGSMAMRSSPDAISAGSRGLVVEDRRRFPPLPPVLIRRGERLALASRRPLLTTIPRTTLVIASPAPTARHHHVSGGGGARGAGCAAIFTPLCYAAAVARQRAHTTRPRPSSSTSPSLRQRSRCRIWECPRTPQDHRTLGTRSRPRFHQPDPRPPGLPSTARRYRESNSGCFDRRARGDSEPLLAVINLDDSSGRTSSSGHAGREIGSDRVRARSGRP